MYSDTKTTRSVAEAVMKVMNEKLHPNQQKLDVHEPEKDELTAKDFEMLRAGKKAKEVKKEEIELNLEDFSLEEFEEFIISEEFQQLDELSKKTIGSYVKKASDDAAKSAAGSVGMANASLRARNPRVKAAAEKYSDEEHDRKEKRLAGIGKAVKRLTKEEIQQILEYESKDGKFVHNAKSGRYGGSEKPTDPFAGVRGPGKKDLEKIEKEKKKKKFSEMVATYQEEGLKSLKEMFIKEEPTNDEYKKELEDAKAKAGGTKTNPDIAKGKVDAVKQEEVQQEETEQLNEIGDTPAGQKLLKKVDSRAFYHGGTKKGGKANMADAGEKTLERTQARIKKEEVEQLDELDAAAIAAYKASPASNKKSSVPHRAGPGPSKFKEKMAAVSRTGDKGHDYFGHDSKRQQSGYRGKGQSVMQTAADKVKKGIGAIKKVFSREEVELALQEFNLEELQTYMMSEHFNELDTSTQDIIHTYLEEREMTDSEMKKREEIVKSMKKGMQGFKERYGDRAKNVMYATATKQAMKEETESEHYKAGHEYASDHAQDSGFKVTARARKKEMLSDNPHKKGTKEHSDWHRGALDGHQTALDNM